MATQGHRNATGQPVLHPRRLLIGVAGLAFLAGCVDEEQRFVSAPEADLGSEIAGELTSSSDVNLNDGTRHAAHWLCGTTEDVAVRYVLDTPFAARLSAFDEQGRWLGSASGSPDGEPATLLASPRSEACTLVVVNGQDGGAFGPYRLTPAPASSAEALDAGQPLVGRLEDGRSEYPLTLDAPARVDLSLSGNPDLAMRLVGEDETRQARSCADGELRLEAYLEAGDYRVQVERGESPAADVAERCQHDLLSTAGAFRLQAEQHDLSDGWRNAGPLRDGDHISGRLEAGSPNVYRLDIDEPTSVTLSLRSSAFDTLLRVSGPGSELSDDDGGSGTDSRLQSVFMPGEYRVEVSSYGAGVGEYALDVSRSAFDGEFRNDGELTLGESLRGTLGMAGTNAYRFEVEETSEVELALDSGAFDPMLRLHGNGIELSDDDGGGNRNSLITTVLEPGEYVVAVESYSGTGLYNLRTEARAFDGEFRNDGELTPGESLRGQLGMGRNAYRFEVEETSEVELALDSGAFDPVLRLHGNGVDRRDDDGGGNRNSLITTVLEPGEYVVEVESYSGTGPYSLRAEASAFEGRIVDGGEVALGETVYGQLSTVGSLNYRLDLETARDVVIESTSSAVDTVLRLSGAGVSAQNDDAGDLGLGSRIRRRLEPGSYDIEVSAFGSSTGMVRLSIGE
ncbi:PPC domain-containing protein [Halomonas koreensis]|uniref:PPC domain-containing protein n=1 Tax=Halomonas koreensis TaxID=245385 RepID=A0ABU1G6V4_9GAMM|nr:PPC domain-containing protein [Halomonas koreensis]MDR5868675.1 PPC domain-containing protein [Halomonas koreensis]